MKPRFRDCVAPVLALLSLLLLVSCPGCNTETIRGSGVIKAETRDVADFSEVESAGSADVRVERGDEDALTVEADDNILPLIETTVKDGKLRLKMKDNVSVNTTKPIVFRIATRRLNAVAISGAGNIDAKNVDATSFSITISGSGTITASGKTETLAVTISGSGAVDTLHMPAKTVKATVTGDGDIDVHADEKLDVNIVGSGSIEYTGSPQISRRIVGSGNISPKRTE
jgi:hypothetical protein